MGEAVKLNGPELWEIVFGETEGAEDTITDEQFTKIADVINEVFIAPKDAEIERLREARDLIADWIIEAIDVQLPVQLFGLHGHVAIQPQQIKPNNSPHSHPRFRRGHYRDRVTSQLRSAA